VAEAEPHEPRGGDVPVAVADAQLVAAEPLADALRRVGLAGVVALLADLELDEVLVEVADQAPRRLDGAREGRAVVLPVGPVGRRPLELALVVRPERVRQRAAVQMFPQERQLGRPGRLRPEEALRVGRPPVAAEPEILQRHLVDEPRGLLHQMPPLEGPRDGPAPDAPRAADERHLPRVEHVLVDVHAARVARLRVHVLDDVRRVDDLGGTREMQRRFDVSVPRARVPEKASTRRDRSER
jgi:hypothetical protein